MTRAEVEAMMSAAQNQRDLVILEVGFYAGLRVSEICKLRIEDMDLVGGELLVRQGKGGKDRVVPLPSHLVRRLSDWVGMRTEGPVFQRLGRRGRPSSTEALSARLVQLMVEGTAKRAGITSRVSPGKLRHAYATELLRCGAEFRQIRDLLGHSSLDTTQIYIDVPPPSMRDAVSCLQEKSS